MNDDTIELTLPPSVGEETLVAIEKQVSAKKRGNPGLFDRQELAKGKDLFTVGERADALYVLTGGTIRLRVVDGRPVSQMPVTTLYHAKPASNANRPILGALYLFSRMPVTLAYRAETACSLYRITAESLRRLYQVDTESLYRMVYWLIGSSDVSEIFVPIANKALGLETIPVTETQGLLRASEEFLAARTHPKMENLLGVMYDKFMSQRKKRGEELGLELSRP